MSGRYRRLGSFFFFSIILFIINKQLDDIALVFFAHLVFVLFCVASLLVMLYDSGRIRNATYVWATLALLSVAELPNIGLLVAFSWMNPLVLMVWAMVVMLFFVVFPIKHRGIRSAFTLLFSLFFMGTFLMISLNQLAGGRFDLTPTLNRSMVEHYKRTTGNIFIEIGASPYRLFVFDHGKKVGVFQPHLHRLVLVDVRSRSVIKRFAHIISWDAPISFKKDLLLFPEARSGIMTFSKKKMTLKRAFNMSKTSYYRTGDADDEFREWTSILYSKKNKALFLIRVNGDILYCRASDFRPISYDRMFKVPHVRTWTKFDNALEQCVLVNDSIILSNAFGGTVRAYDLRTRTIAGVSHSFGPGGNIALSDSGRFFYKTNTMMGLLLKIDVRTMKIVQVWFIKPGIRHICVKDTFVYVSNIFTGELTELNMQNGRVRSVGETLSRIEQVQWSDNKLYVSHEWGLSVVPVGPARGFARKGLFRTFPFDLRNFPFYMFNDVARGPFFLLRSLLLCFTVCASFILLNIIRPSR